MNEMLYMQNIILYSLTCLQEEDQVVHLLWKFLCTSLHPGSCQPQHPQWVRLWRVQKRRSLCRNGLTLVIQAVHTLTKHHEYLSSCSVPCEHDIVSNQLSASLPVDNDPHFIIHLPRSNMDICFNIDSKPGHILNLLSDTGTGSKCSKKYVLVFCFSWLYLQFTTVNNHDDFSK